MCPKAMLRKSKPSCLLQILLLEISTPLAVRLTDMCTAFTKGICSFGNFHLEDVKPKDLWLWLCGKVKMHQLMKAGDLLNMHINNLGVGGRHWA